MKDIFTENYASSEAATYAVRHLDTAIPLIDRAVAERNAKIFVLDTNVLIQSSHAVECFDDNIIVIPITVLEELDKKKKEDSEAGRNARASIRLLEELRDRGNLNEGISLKNGGLLIVVMEMPFDIGFDPHKNDNKILAICRKLQEARPWIPTILVSKDILLRVKAESIGIQAQDFLNEKVGNEEYTGRIEVFVPESCFDTFRSEGIDIEKAYISYSNPETGEFRKDPVTDIHPNQFVVLKSDVSMKTQLGRVSTDLKRIVKLEYDSERPYGIAPRNLGQHFLQEALMQPAEVAPCVIVTGPAGSAKTFYSLAVGLEHTYNQRPKRYRRILICRPNAAFESEGIGYLPGDENEKIAPLMRPIIDNLEILLDSNESERYKDERSLQGKISEIFDREIIRTEALNYIRGRSLVDTFLIIDEAQNCTPAQAKGILTRAGKGTKIILLGDPKQIDKPYLDEKTNGLSYAMDRMKNSKLSWQIALDAEECERSDLALEAANLL